MSHEHSFSREGEKTFWDEQKQQMVVERNCNVKMKNSTVGSTLSGGAVVNETTEYCDVVKQDWYEIRSVVDNHNEHNGPHCVIVSDDGVASTDGSKHISEFKENEVPEWVFDIEERAEKVVDQTDAEMLLAHLSGAEIPLDIATSDSEYTVVFSRVESTVVS